MAQHALFATERVSFSLGVLCTAQMTDKKATKILLKSKHHEICFTYQLLRRNIKKFGQTGLQMNRAYLIKINEGH